MGIQVPGGELHSSPEIFVATSHQQFLKNFFRSSVKWLKLNTAQSKARSGLAAGHNTKSAKFSSLFILSSSTTSQFHISTPLASAEL